MVCRRCTKYIQYPHTHTHLHGTYSYQNVAGSTNKTQPRRRVSIVTARGIDDEARALYMSRNEFQPNKCAFAANSMENKMCWWIYCVRNGNQTSWNCNRVYVDIRILWGIFLCAHCRQLEGLQIKTFFEYWCRSARWNIFKHCEEWYVGWRETIVQPLIAFQSK